MANPSFRLSSSQGEDLLKVCSLGREPLLRLTTLLSNPDEPAIISRSILRSRFAQEIPPECLEAASRVCIGLAITARDNFISSDEFASALDEAVSLLGWSEENKNLWRGVRQPFVALIYARDLVIAAKAVDLIFDFEKFCLNSRIITDIRPVFDDERNRIVGGIIMHTLRVEYRADDGSRRNISIELDSRDIDRLARSCEDAARKMERAKSLFRDNLELPFITATEGLE